MPLSNTTVTATATTNMEAQLSHDTIPTTSIHHTVLNLGDDSTIQPEIPDPDSQFEESHCLFCDKQSSGLDDNLIHMSTMHGFYIAQTNLLVDVGTLLDYFHVIIYGYHECLYCGKQKHSLEAIRQHMTAKGHCKYDISDEDSELRDFFDFSNSDAKEEFQQRQLALSDGLQQSAKAKSKKNRISKVSEHNELPEQTDLVSQSHNESSDSNSDPGIQSTRSQVTRSARILRQEHEHNNQLARLSAADRNNLIHLPMSQQRSILATYHGQLRNARRAQQTQRTNLETAGNYFNRLGTVRLIRQPPHFGGVSSLKR